MNSKMIDTLKDPSKAKNMNASSLLGGVQNNKKSRFSKSGINTSNPNNDGRQSNLSNQNKSGLATTNEDSSEGITISTFL